MNSKLNQYQITKKWKKTNSSAKDIIIETEDEDYLDIKRVQSMNMSSNMEQIICEASSQYDSTSFSLCTK